MLDNKEPMNTWSELDQELAKKYGLYASYSTEVDPILVESYNVRPLD